MHKMLTRDSLRAALQKLTQLLQGISVVSLVEPYHYPRVCGSEVVCLLSWSGWARFLRPVGPDHRVCALTDD